jgi:dienelactone hydrolase
MVEQAQSDSAPITVQDYPGVRHAFDVGRFSPAVSFLGHRLEYNAAAAKDAEARVRAFLAANLGHSASGH